jgi:hypothetical protein
MWKVNSNILSAWFLKNFSLLLKALYYHELIYWLTLPMYLSAGRVVIVNWLKGEALVPAGGLGPPPWVPASSVPGCAEVIIDRQRMCGWRYFYHLYYRIHLTQSSASKPVSWQLQPLNLLVISRERARMMKQTVRALSDKGLRMIPL